jgi:hypothetical protein
MEFGDGICGVSGQFEQVCPNGMEAMMLAELTGESVEYLQTGPGPIDHRNGHGSVESHHRIARHVFQAGIQGLDLWPVRVPGVASLGVHTCNGRLQLVLPDAVLLECFGDQGESLTHEAPIPLDSVLMGERYETSVSAGTGRTPSIRQEHQGE